MQKGSREVKVLDRYGLIDYGLFHVEFVCPVAVEEDSPVAHTCYRIGLSKDTIKI